MGDFKRLLTACVLVTKPVYIIGKKHTRKHRASVATNGIIRISDGLLDSIPQVDETDAFAQSGDAIEATHCSADLVFGVGVFKTGTTSMSDFFEKLSYNVEYGGRGPIWEDLEEDITAAAIREFIVDAEKSSTGNPFMRLDRSPHQVAYISQTHTTLLTCALSRAYPKAMFVLTTRDVDRSWPGFQQTWCTGMRDESCKQTVIEGLTMGFRDAGCGSMCDTNAKLIEYICAVQLCDGDAVANTSSWETARELYRATTELHISQTRECVPPDKLLEIAMDEQSEIVQAASVQAFLGCTGPQQMMRHLNKLSDVTSDDDD